MGNLRVVGAPPMDSHRLLRAPRPRQHTIASFGPQAERWRARLISGEYAAVLADSSSSAEALEEAMQRRASNFLLTGPVLDEARSVVAQRLASLIIARTSDRAVRRAMFAALARGSLVLDNITQGDLRAIDQNVEETLRDFYLVGSATIVRSRRQAAYLGNLFGRSRPGYVIRPGIDFEVPPPQAREEETATVVVWAPNIDISALSICLFALEHLKAPIVIIGSGDASSFPEMRVSSLANARKELSQAALVIDTTLSDPASAIALAAWKIPLVATSTSGSDEFIQPVRLYDPWNWRSILAAVSAARADAPSNVSLKPVKVSIPGEERSPISNRNDDPLVTIIIPTFDRLDILPIALESVDAQSYRNFEVLVINDAGPSVDEIVSRYPKARCINVTVNSGYSRCCNNGVLAARGKYITFFADDDIYYFDHIERLVAALEQSQALVAHSNVLTRFLEADSRGILRTSGSQVMYSSHLDVTEALWAGQQALGAFLIRRDVFDQVGMLDEQNVAADFEMSVRLSRSFDFVHVDHVTYEWRYRTDGSTLSHKVGIAAIEKGILEIFERYPSNGDTLVEKGRAATLKFFREHVETQFYAPALRLAINAHSNSVTG